MNHAHRKPRDIFLSLVLVVLLFILFACSARANGIVMVCEKDKECTPDNARIVFVVPTSPIPTACLLTASQKAAQVSDLIGTHELVRIQCGR